MVIELHHVTVETAELQRKRAVALPSILNSCTVFLTVQPSSLHNGHFPLPHTSVHQTAAPRAQIHRRRTIPSPSIPQPCIRSRDTALGSRYEGVSRHRLRRYSLPPKVKQNRLPSNFSTNQLPSRSVAPRHPHPALLPSRSAQNNLYDSDLPPECGFQDR